MSDRSGDRGVQEAVAVVCADIATARAAIDAGDNVVLIGDDAAGLGVSAAGFLAGDAGRGRLSVFVGDPSLGEVWSAASAMAAEQYRSGVRIERRAGSASPRPACDGGRVP